MNKRQKYFLKQKLIGLCMILIAVLAGWLLEGGIAASIIFGPIGLMLLFSKRMIITDDYFFEMQEREKQNEEL